MDSGEIVRILSGVAAVIVLGFIIWRRKRIAMR
jgi:hypothetical protein